MWDLTIETLHWLQETINCIIQDKFKTRQRFNLFQTCSDLEATNLSSLVVAKSKFPLITYFSTIEIRLYSLYRKKAFTRLRKREKKTGHCALRENDDLPRAQAKPPFS